MTQPKSVQLSSYVQPEIFDRVRTMAEEEGLSISRIAQEIFLIGLPAREDMSKRRKAELGI